MTRAAPRLAWLPPLLVGASAAVAAEVSMSVLLYGGAGFVRSLTTILAVEALAFAGGLWSAPAAGSGLVDRLRRRWLLCLIAFIVAAAFGTAWSLFPPLGETRWGQGAGLALLAGVPLYGAGAVLASMSVVARTDVGRRIPAPGPAAAGGFALGFVLTGVLLPRVPIPASLIVGCLVLLSLAGMVYGVVLGSRTEVELLARRPGRGPDVVVEERTVPRDDIATRELREGEFPRRIELREGANLPPWDVAVVRAFLPRPGPDPDGEADGEDRVETTGDASWRVLVVGGGVSSLPRTVLEAHPAATVEVLERTASVVELGREHFDTELTVGVDGRLTVRTGNLDDGIAACDGAYQLVVVDSAALAPVGGPTALSRMARRRLPALVAPGGGLAWGPDGSGLILPDAVPGWTRSEYRRSNPLRGDAGEERVVLLRREPEAERTPLAVEQTPLPVGSFRQTEGR